MSRKISEGRKGVYYLGMVLGVIGLLLFLSVFVSGAMNFGNFSNFEARGRSMATRAVTGMVLMIAGGFLTSVGRAGLAGSGLKLDPEEARDELEPFSRQAGGMLKDMLDEAEINIGGGGDEREQVIMIRCQSCGKLNDEDAKFCDECGKKL